MTSSETQPTPSTLHPDLAPLAGARLLVPTPPPGGSLDRGEAVELIRRVDLDRPRSDVRAARLLVTAHGVVEAFLDGTPASEDLLTPGWTAYEQRLDVAAWDVTTAVRDGAPGTRSLTLSARLGNGWWRGDLGFAAAEASYGEDLGLLAALEITYVDGTRQVVVTDDAWSARTCDVTANNLYLGQRIDARLRAGAGRAVAVRTRDLDPVLLTPRVAEPVRRHEVLRPRRVWRSPSGRVLLDFGQNLVGWLRLRVAGPAGTEITARHAEVLEHGELGTRPLRLATATDTFVLAGTGGPETFEPTLTFHGFRYAELTGWPDDLVAAVEAGTLAPDAIEAVVVHTAMRPTAEFECSEPLVDQLVRNSVWGQKGNFLALPTDCPQRDERLGWTGDIAAYAATAAFQFDAADLLHSWLIDLAHETRAVGFVPVIVPFLVRHGRLDLDSWEVWRTPQAVWSDAACWVPRALWWAYGDVDRLAAHYPGMVAHLESVEPVLSASGLWDGTWQLADWLDPDAPPDDPAAAKADPGVVATAALHHSAAFAAEAATVLGHDEDAARWTALAARLRSAFRTHYVTDDADGLRVRSDCATVYALALRLGLLDEGEDARAAARLAEIVAAGDHRVTTGFAGTPFVTWALSEHGYPDVAYRLLLERECPSWLYPVTMGATTIWERWDSMLPDGTINPGEMTSFNHYALGAVADWIYQVVGGIRPAEPGYRRVLVQPVPGPGIDRARCAYDARVGRIESSWSVDGDVFRLRVEIPDGVPADVVLPDGTRHVVGGGTHDFTCAVHSPAPRGASVS
ncbi:alpha-L-rhamnosidase [Salana multivorans]|uniref:alpha-L-rhamnosidase n=1 Tax=Salana multivorans TaxID=120377 RepID=A0A3N2D238_9MICO|nr:alpha-L-rhamnosidase [Salana multivorans]